MKNIVLFSFLFFLIFSNEALAETESKVIIDVRTESEWLGGHLQGDHLTTQILFEHQ